MLRRHIVAAIVASSGGSLVSEQSRSAERAASSSAQTAAERAAGIIPSNYDHAPGVVERYGATGDGLADDTAAWKAALSLGIDVSATPNRRYLLTAELDIPQDVTVNLQNSTLLPTATLTSNTQKYTNPNCFALTHSQFRLCNGRIDLSRTSGRGIHASTAIQRFLFENLSLTDAAGTAIELQDCYTGLFRNILVARAKGRSVLLHSTIGQTPVNSIWFDRLSIGGSSYQGNAVEIQGAAAVFFTNCDWQNNANGPASTELRIDSNAYAGSTHIIVENGYFEDGRNIGGNCIYVGDPASGSSAHVGIRVLGCYFQSSRQNIRVGTHVNDDCIIRDCCFNFVSGSAPTAIAVTGSPRPKVVDCTGSLPII